MSGRERVIGVVGWSGSGKTTLIERLIPILRAAGLRVGVLKHSGHPHPLHPPGTDTARLQLAGADPVGFETPVGSQWTRLGAAGPTLPPAGCDLLLVEGNVAGRWPKLEVWRPELGGLRTYRQEELLAVVSDAPPPADVPRLSPSDVEAIAALLLARLKDGRLQEARDASKGLTGRAVLRIGHDTAVEELDEVAIEEPLEIRLGGETVAVTMRTPGDDPRLALGFLFAEGIVRGVEDVGTVAHCGRPGDEGYGNVIDVSPAPGVDLEIEPLAPSRRGTLVSAACGVCGRRSIDDLLERCAPLPASAPVPASLLTSSVGRLGELQAIFRRTGGVHAAAAFDRDGALLAAAEDVGRHNAVDKVVGRLLLDGALSRAALLAVSGRSSFEIVQKAATARIPVVAGVSAASSLAIDLAERTGVTLAAFVRGERLNVYSHPERLEG